MHRKDISLFLSIIDTIVTGACGDLPDEVYDDGKIAADLIRNRLANRVTAARESLLDLQKRLEK